MVGYSECLLLPTESLREGDLDRLLRTSSMSSTRSSNDSSNGSGLAELGSI
jgi:hypothetical protein